MSTFNVVVTPIVIKPHPNADLLEVGQVFGEGGYQLVVGKGQYKSGDLVAYIPEGALIPDPLIQEMGLQGRLSGAKQNRVKAVRLRGVLSQGLAYAPSTDDKKKWPAEFESRDVADLLGIVKYVPPIPTDMAGNVTASNDRGGPCLAYDIENIKRYPDVFLPDDEVVATEKLHGTLTAVGVWVDPELGRLDYFVSSKGLLQKGLYLNENSSNLYWRAQALNNLVEKLKDAVFSGQSFVQDKDKDKANVNVGVAGNDEQGQQQQQRTIPQLVLFGETYGDVQDLKYGLEHGGIAYRAFDLWFSENTTSGFVGYDGFKEFCDRYDIPTVPELYRGKWAGLDLAAITSGKSTLADHIREGVVIKPITEQRMRSLGRCILKSVSPDYLLRKNANATEFE